MLGWLFGDDDLIAESTANSMLIGLFVGVIILGVVAVVRK